MRYSQYEEDAIIQKFFGGHVGTFLDLGAADGELNSNTRSLALAGWSGCCVEPSPLLFFDLFQLYRLQPKITLVHAALSQNNALLKFFHANQLSTASTETVSLDNMNPLFLGSFWISSITPTRLETVAGNDFDFISLDCEAMDLEIAGASKSLFSKAKLLCYEHTLPGRPTDAGYLAQCHEMAQFHGFTQFVGRTEGNVLVAR